jgi:hypothetical protein
VAKKSKKSKKKTAKERKFDKLRSRAYGKLEGDAEQIALDAYLEQLTKHSNKTLGKFIDILEKDGSLEAVMNVDMATLAKVFVTTAKRGRKGKKALAGGKRLSKADMEKLEAEILAYVKVNPGCRKKDIAAGLKLPSKKLFSPMKALLAEKKLKTEGVRAGMKYSVK